MSTNPTARVCIAARLPAEPGWLAVVMQQTGPCTTDASKTMVRVEARKIAAWRIMRSEVVIRSGVSALLGSAMAHAMGIFGGEGISLEPEGEDGQPLPMEKIMGIYGPGTTVADAEAAAVAHIEWLNAQAEKEAAKP